MAAPDAPAPEPQQKPGARLGRWVRYSAVGMQFAGGIVGLALLGWWLDGWVGTGKPWFALTGALLGMVGGMWQLIRQFGKKLED